MSIGDVIIDVKPMTPRVSRTLAQSLCCAHLSSLVNNDRGSFAQRAPLSTWRIATINGSWRQFSNNTRATLFNINYKRSASYGGAVAPRQNISISASGDMAYLNIKRHLAACIVRDSDVWRRRRMLGDSGDKTIKQVSVARYHRVNY